MLHIYLPSDEAGPKLSLFFNQRMIVIVTVFRHVICHRRFVRRQQFAPTSLLFVAADAYSRLFCEFFSVAKANSFLITQPNKDNITRQLF